MFKLAKASIYSMLLALLLASCSMGSNAPRGTAVISVVGNTSASSRSAMSRSTGTLIPEEVPSIVSFDVSLSAVELKDGKWVQSEDKSGNIKNESFSADYSSETQDLTITGVKAGTYRVSLVGLDSSGNAIMNGSSDENLVDRLCRFCCFCRLCRNIRRSIEVNDICYTCNIITLCI